jgi:hypothetical protein
MHLKVFVKLKKNPLVWAKKPKKTPKNPKKNKKTQKNPLGCFFFFPTRVFSNPNWLGGGETLKKICNTSLIRQDIAYWLG